MTITIYHNPRCSKSRQTLALLGERGLEPVIVEYLKSPPDAEQLRQIMDGLGISARELLRKGEALYKDLDLGDPGTTEDQIISAMIANPILIERPIVVTPKGVKLGRPPEAVLEIL
jgi:arsenate reductase